MPVSEILIKEARDASSRLRWYLARLLRLDEDLQAMTDAYVSGNGEDVDSDMRLRALTLMASTVLRTMSLPPKQVGPSETGTDAQVGHTVRLSVSGRWQAFEFSRTFGAISYLHQLAAISEFLKQDQTRQWLTKSHARQNVYERADLYYFLHRDEELKFVKFVSPRQGKSSLYLRSWNTGRAYLTYYGDSWLYQSIAAPPVIRRMSRAIRGCVEDYCESQERRLQLREQQRRDERREQMHKILQQELHRLDEISPSNPDEGLNVNARSLLRVVEIVGGSDLVDPLALLSRTASQLDHVARMAEDGKLTIPTQSNETDVADRT